MDPEMPAPSTEASAGPRRRCVGCRRGLVAAGSVVVLSFLALAEVLRRYGWQEIRPVCEPGEDPAVRDCLPEMSAEDWKNPSFALVKPDAKIMELRWHKGKLMHPIGRYFGGHHSTLVAVFADGREVRIEKFGQSSVQYCPTIAAPKCNTRPAEVYKSAGGSFLRNITWQDLHAAMMYDLDHYDVVDANCHHAVRNAWNFAVVPRVQDPAPAPDTGVLKYWEEVLRYWSGTDQELAGDSEEGVAYSIPLRALQANSSNNTGGGGTAEVAATVDLGPGAYFTNYGEPVLSFDGHTSRRRRRRQKEALRCHGSSIEGEDNCPHRRSSHSDESSSKGGRSSKKQKESFMSKRSHWVFCFKWWSDKDISRSDSFFFQKRSSGKEYDISGSTHWRVESCRPSSQSNGASQESSVEMQPMDPREVQSNSKAQDASSICASEISHSQNHRSSNNDANVCNTRLGGVTKVSGDYLCQWQCTAGTAVYSYATTSTYVCQSEKEFDFSLAAGSSEQDCLVACATSGCTDDCVGKCRYLTSAALDAGQATCVDTATNMTTSTGVVLEPIPQRKPSPGLNAIIACSILCWCCCCCCQLCLLRKKKTHVQGY